MYVPTMTMFCGLPASGKSTYAEKLAKETDAIILSSDAIRWELFGDETDQDHNQKVFQELHKRAKEYLNNGKNVIYDATNISSKRRRAFLDELKKIDCIKNCIVMATPYKQCLENNRNRARQVPEWAIERMYRKWQTPHWFEGWDNIDIEYWDNEHFIYPERVVSSLMDFDQQNPHHTLTLGEHLLKTFKLCNVDDLDYTEACNVLNACLLHDCGKPFCQTFKNAKGELGEIAHYYNHEHVSAYESLFNGYLDTKDIVEVSALVTWHMQPYFYEKNDNEKLHNKYKRIWGERFYNMVTALHRADKAAH